MRTYKLTIAYDGTRYQGWQRQANTDRTIQGILERTVGEMLRKTGNLRENFPVEVNGSGRTGSPCQRADGQRCAAQAGGGRLFYGKDKFPSSGGYPHPGCGACEEWIPCPQERSGKSI